MTVTPKEAVLLIEKLVCEHESAEGGKDDVFMEIYTDYSDTPILRWPEEGNVQMGTNHITSVNVAIDVTYTDRIRVEVIDQDNHGTQPLGTLEITRKEAREKLDTNDGCGYTAEQQTTGEKRAKYGINWRVLTEEIPTLRIFGIRCEHSTAGMNEEVVNLALGAAATGADYAAKVIKKSPRPRAKVISEGFKAASKALEEIAEIVTWLADAFEGLDDIYMKRIYPTRGLDGAFFPKEDDTYHLDDGDEVIFEEEYGGEYFRFPIDKEPVTIELYEFDPVKTDIIVGRLTVEPADLNDERLEGAAVVEMADPTIGDRNGEGAIYWVCYGIGWENWAARPTASAQKDRPDSFPRDGEVQHIINTNSGLALTRTESYGACVQMPADPDNRYQRWEFFYSDDETDDDCGRIFEYPTNSCLRPKGDYEGAEIISQASGNNPERDFWKVEDAGDGSVYLVNQGGNKNQVLAIGASSTDSGKPAIIWPKDDPNDDQKWRFDRPDQRPAQFPMEDKVYRIVNANSGLVVTRTESYGACVQMPADPDNRYQRWQFRYSDGDYGRIFEYPTNSCLRPKSDAIGAEIISQASGNYPERDFWKIEDAGDGNVYLLNQGGDKNQVLVIGASSMDPGKVVSLWTKMDTTDDPHYEQKWRFESIDA